MEPMQKACSGWLVGMGSAYLSQARNLHHRMMRSYSDFRPRQEMHWGLHQWVTRLYVFPNRFIPEVL